MFFFYTYIHIQSYSIQHTQVLTTASREATNKPVVDWEKLSVVGRLGGDMYTRVVNSLDLPRPDRKV